MLTQLVATPDLTCQFMALRFFTYTLLGIPHISCDPDADLFEWPSSKTYPVDDRDNIKEEHSYEFALLRDLLAELEPRLASCLDVEEQGLRGTSVMEFWLKKYSAGMDKVLEELRGNKLSEKGKKAAEEIGVVWKEDNACAVPMDATYPTVFRPENPYSCHIGSIGSGS